MKLSQSCLQIKVINVLHDGDRDEEHDNEEANAY